MAVGAVLIRGLLHVHVRGRYSSVSTVSDIYTSWPRFIYYTKILQFRMWNIGMAIRRQYQDALYTWYSIRHAIPSPESMTQAVYCCRDT